MKTALLSSIASFHEAYSRQRTLAVFTILALVLAVDGRAGEPIQRFPGAPTDMIVASHQGQAFVFLADPQSGSIYWHPLDDRDLADIPFFVFEEFLHSPDFPAPAALAYWQKKLLFVDRRTSRLVEVDPDTRETRVLLGPPEIHDPVSLAVSEDGVIAIGEDGPDSVVLVSAASVQPCQALPGDLAAEKCPAATLRKLGKSFDEPDRLSFVGPDLLILDTDSRTISAVPRDERSNSAAEAAEETVDMIHRRFPRVREFANFRGIYYIADAGKIVALSPGSGMTSSPIPCPDDESPRIAAAEHALLIRSRQSVLLRPRPIPVSVNLELVQDKSPEQNVSSQYLALTSLYAYLDARSMLPVREREARRDYVTLRELLLDEDVLIRRPDAPEIPASNPEADAKMGEVLCRLNDFGCSSGIAAAVLDRRVSLGEKIRLPQVPIEKSLTSSRVRVTKTVEEHLRERVLPEQLSQIDDEYLYRINRQFLRTWEAFNARENLVSVKKPRADLRPGTLVSNEQGSLVPLGDLQACGEGSEVRSRVVQGPPLLPIASREDILPRGASVPVPGEAESEFQFGVQISFDELVQESIDYAGLRNANAVEPLQRTDPCAAWLNDPNVYLVVEALKALGPRYNVLDKKGSARRMSEAEIARMNLLGHPDVAKRWSLVVDEPVYVAIRLARLNDRGEIERTASKDVNGAQDFLGIEKPLLNLPATKWRLRAFVHSADLGATGSEIDKINSLPGVRVFSEERVFTSPQSADTPGWITDPSTITDDQAKEIIRKNRDDLRKMIHYSPPLPAVSDLVIGVGEDKGSVHCYHPDFVGDGGSAWRQVPSSSELSRSEKLIPMPKPGPNPQLGTPLLKRFSKDYDHGDHVAGILAGRGEIAPGLIPGVGLFLIDTSSTTGLEQSIDDAIQRGVDIFGFSFTIDKLDPTLDDLKEAMVTKWRSQIFIAAAGNDGKDLRSLSVRIPVTWGDDIDNIIGVSATDWSYNVLGAWVPDSSSDAEKGSNFGKKYVQLAAPGFNIYSTASDNKYALASGSSQAVPVVTAAVAMLAAQMQFPAPLVIKARLIYTADWYTPNFDGKVWGGLLNYRRAVWEPNRNLIIYKGNKNLTYSFDLSGNPMLGVKSGEIDDRRGAMVARPREIPFKDILRIQWINAQRKYRVIYLEDDTKTLRILNNADIVGKIPCREPRQWDAGTGAFGAGAPVNAPFGDQCATDVMNIYDYVASIPKVSAINF